MRLLGRNKQTVYYCNFVSATMSGSEGIYTGSRNKTYGDIKTVKAYVKTATGNSTTEPFGSITSKTRTVYYENDAADINDNSLLWVGINPTIVNNKPTVPHNYVVSGVAVGLNQTRVSITKVTVSG